jgi:hypothetical protein
LVYEGGYDSVLRTTAKNTISRVHCSYFGNFAGHLNQKFSFPVRTNQKWRDPEFLRTAKFVHNVDMFVDATPLNCGEKNCIPPRKRFLNEDSALGTPNRRKFANMNQ